MSVLMRLSLLVGALVVTAGCAVPSPSAPSNGPWRFSGTVSAMDGSRTGAPIVGAELMVVEGVNRSARVMSDETGHYLFSGLETGRFTVAVTAPGYISAAPVVDLYRDIDAHFVLKRQ